MIAGGGIGSRFNFLLFEVAAAGLTLLMTPFASSSFRLLPARLAPMVAEMVWYSSR